MSVQVQRFVMETQKWRTVRAYESFLDAQAFMAELPWADYVKEEQWAEYEQIGMALASQVHKFTDLITCVNQTGQLIIRTDRGAVKAASTGHVYICVGPRETAIDVSSYYEVKGSFVRGLSR